MNTITEYRTRIRTILGDPTGRRYSDDVIDMGLSQALDTLQNIIPNKTTIKTKISAWEGGFAVLNICPPPDQLILTIRRETDKFPLLASDYRTGGKTLLQFSAEEERPETGETLLLEVTIPHTVRGLNGAQNTTVPDTMALTISSGAAGYSLLIRARSVTEVFGKRPEDREALTQQAETLIEAYIKDLRGKEMETGFWHDPWPRGSFPI